jgi:hypothetical protein
MRTLSFANPTALRYCLIIHFVMSVISL